MHIAEDDAELCGLSAAQSRPAGEWNSLTRAVWPAMRVVGCMWVFDRDDLPMCGASPRWTYGSEVGGRPRVYCEEHAQVILARRREDRKRRERHGKIDRDETESLDEIITDDRAAEILKMLLSEGERPCLWLIATRTGVRARVVYEIAKQAGMKTSVSWRADGIRDDILAGKLSWEEIAKRHGCGPRAVGYHARLLGMKRTIAWRKP